MYTHTYKHTHAQLSGVPLGVKTASYQTRVIVRDVTGKFAWDSVVLYGPEKTSSQGGECILPNSINKIWTFELHVHCIEK